MILSRMLRWGLISIPAFGYYLAVIYLTGLSTRLTTMSQFFGHALIYSAGVALFSMLFFLVEQFRSKRKAEEIAPDVAHSSH